MDSGVVALEDVSIFEWLTWLLRLDHFQGKGTKLQILVLAFDLSTDGKVHYMRTYPVCGTGTAVPFETSNVDPGTYADTALNCF